MTRDDAEAPPFLPVPDTHVFDALAVSAKRYPERTALSYYGRVLTYAQLLGQSERLAASLCAEGVRPRDRVILMMQNSPQFVVAYYAILRAGAVVVPVNPMNLEEEVLHVVRDSGARFAVVGAEVLGAVLPCIEQGLLQRVIEAAYGQYADPATDLPMPAVVRESLETGAWTIGRSGVTAWQDALANDEELPPSPGWPGDLAALPYSSGTTGLPKGCAHTHGSLMAVIAAAGVLNAQTAADVMLGVAPFFHVTGMQMVMNNAIFLGATLVIMTRWDREAALALIERERVTSWINVPTMVIDLLAMPGLRASQLKSLRHIGGGGAAMPEAVAARLRELTGLTYQEGYGLTETAAPTHSNPSTRAKPQCLGKPIFNTHSLIRDADTGEILGPGKVGEIISSGPQLFQGYWGDPEATQAAFVTIDGRRYFRTGDLGRMDEEGYFYLVDRLKRMINASGYKVWPAEVEALLYGHPDIAEACVIAARDDHRGETVKACIVLRAGSECTAEAIMAWARNHMAAYKIPRQVEFLERLPKTGTGKVLWRALQERQT